ncbi:hypothetical protein CABS01_17268 [Colletotrichum abscissum]|uniref:uncharacterized protein n=1 Tax=Colletotrichum abscissum TaxID=1671311 RepID=UPI0027D6390B|nr:uncharacterized protein CABS01_17268 [Colletotrichum abscissum]KAK1479795.1 hypothetical protein CABS01_17268 [Colletotrichum abscissum]
MTRGLWRPITAGFGFSNIENSTVSAFPVCSVERTFSTVAKTDSTFHLISVDDHSNGTAGMLFLERCGRRNSDPATSSWCRLGTCPFQ